MTLERFAMLGQAELGPDGEEISAGEPRRSLVRYGDDGERFFHTRLNPDLWRAALAFPVMHVMPVPGKDELLVRDGLLAGLGSVRNYELLESLGDGLSGAGCAASYLAERHGGGRRDFYFATESPDPFRTALAQAAERASIEVGAEVLSFADAALQILPIEWLGRLGLAPPDGHDRRKTRFGFWGAEESLSRLRAQLERVGFTFQSFESATRELRMTKVVPLDAAGFLAELRVLVPLSRSLRCSYLGEETVDPRVFLLTAPEPLQYFPPKRSLFSRWFGGEGEG